MGVPGTGEVVLLDQGKKGKKEDLGAD